MGGTPSMLYSGAVEAAAGALVGTAVSSVTTTCEMQEGLDMTLYSLKQELLKIQSVISAARRRRITDQHLLEWLASLIDAYYLGNYYHRTLKNQNSHPQMIASEGSSNLAISPFYRPAKRQRAIKKLFFGDEELKELNEALRKLKTIDTNVFILMVNTLPERPLKTYLYMDHNRLLYREKEREQVMSFLFEPSMEGGNNVDILPIVGPGAVGKTSLALHCFHDPKVQNYFSLKIYKCFSSLSYNNWESYFYEEILKGCNITDTSNGDEKTLIAMLKQKLSSERFMLVMDRVGKMDLKLWNALLDCLRCGEKGSKVILVFDSYHYGKVWNALLYKKFIIPSWTLNPIILDGFSEEDYMMFFKEHAFGSADPDDHPELEKVGREIAERMNGSIWGAKIFGELLRDNLNAQFWSSFLRDGIMSSHLQLRDAGSGPVSFAMTLWPVIDTCSKLLQRRLRLSGISLKLFGAGEESQNFSKIKSIRELMVLGPNHCTPTVEWTDLKILDVLVTKHVFLNECTVITAQFRSGDD